MLSKYFLPITRPRGVQGGWVASAAHSWTRWVGAGAGGGRFCRFLLLFLWAFPSYAYVLLPPTQAHHTHYTVVGKHTCTHACMPHPTPPSLGHCRRRASPTPPHPTLKNTRTLPPNTPRRWQASWWRQRSERAVIPAHPPPPPPLLARAHAPTFLASPTTSLCCCRWPASWGQPYHHTHKHARTRMLTKYHPHPLRRRWPASWWRRRATGA